MDADDVLDCYGLLCPMPIVETAKKIKGLEEGDVLEIVSTDAGIKEDMPAWCRQTGHQFLGLKQEDDVLKVYVKKMKA